MFEKNPFPVCHLVDPVFLAGTLWQEIITTPQSLYG